MNENRIISFIFSAIFVGIMILIINKFYAKYRHGDNSKGEIIEKDYEIIIAPHTNIVPENNDEALLEQLKSNISESITSRHDLFERVADKATKNVFLEEENSTKAINNKESIDSLLTTLDQLSKEGDE